MTDMSREWELDGATHRTRDDARAQITKAKLGAHVASTELYLVALRADLYTWIGEIDVELARRAREQADAADREERCDCDGCQNDEEHES